MLRLIQRHRTRLALAVVVAVAKLATPRHPILFRLGALVVLLGEAIRLYASGFIVKLDRVTTGGPYAVVRNPLYVGSFVSAMGAAVVAGNLSCLALFLLFFGLVYPPTVLAEERELEEKFGDEYRAYKARVPRFVPALGAERPPSDARFDPATFRRNREWIGLLVWLAVLGLLYAKMNARAANRP